VRELQQLSDTKEDLLQRLSRDLRDPLSNITMAIQLLKIAPSEPARQRYLQVLQEECAREIALLNQLSNLQELLSPENANILQRLNLFREQTDEKDSSH
jgi:signal transduction histidine kinase